MPRIRSIKPESLQHRKIGRLSDRAFRLWIGLLTQADDEGRGVADPGQLRVVAFGYHPDVSDDDMVRAITELAACHLVRFYQVEGTPYYVFDSWSDHQKISHPAPSKLPAPPPILQNPPEDSGILQNVPQGSDLIGENLRLTTLRPITAPNLLKSLENQPNSLKSLTNQPDADARRSQPRATLAHAREILHWLNAKAGKSYRDSPANLDPIRARLDDGIEPWQLRAVVSRKVREWGPDPKMAKFLRPETLFNRTKCESYLGELPPLDTNGNGHQPGMPGLQ